MMVAPFVGAWIETPITRLVFTSFVVAPFVGAWIETNTIRANIENSLVAPFVGAWIETLMRSVAIKYGISSLPSWERGLKQLDLTFTTLMGDKVAPFVGAWIETASQLRL